MYSQSTLNVCCDITDLSSVTWQNAFDNRPDYFGNRAHFGTRARQRSVFCNTIISTFLQAHYSYYCNVRNRFVVEWMRATRQVSQPVTGGTRTCISTHSTGPQRRQYRLTTFNSTLLPSTQQSDVDAQLSERAMTNRQPML